MDVWNEILTGILLKEVSRIPDRDVLAAALVEEAAFQALERIKAVLEDDGLSDPACFARIEEIVQIFEDLGSSGGNRHDFG